MLPQPVQYTLETADATIEKAVTENHLPGIGVGIVYKGELIYAKGFGHSNVERGTAVTPATVFRIASISKTFAAVGLMQLWEQGKFDLHAPVNDYLKAFKVRVVGKPVTFHHLLTHTAGIGEFAQLSKYFNPQAHFNVVKAGKPVPPLKELYGKELVPERPPGEKWSYANNGYATVGQLVEDISGIPFPEYMRRHIFQPLHMDSAEFWRSERVKPKLAVGYKYQGKKEKFRPVADLEQITTAAGSMYASVNDMGRYISALMNEGKNEFGQILKPETLNKMFTPQFQLDPRLQGMGYGFKVDDWDGHRVVSHDGLWLGFISSMFVAPDDDLGVIAITNTAESVAISIAQRLLQRALAYTERPLKKGATEKPPETPELWPEFVGFYAPPPGWNTNFRLLQQYGGEFEVYVEDNALMIRSTWGSWKDGRKLNRSDPDDPRAFKVGSRDFIFHRGNPDELWMELNGFEKKPYDDSIKSKLDKFGISKLLDRN
ncbi:MAG: beta-lactamase family protein [Anaerolineales bacterium]|nr:beta-lactamase family protein [Anaerolineales bacterium]